MAAPVILYTKAGCSYCDAMRAALAVRGAVVDEIDVGTRREAIPELLKLTRGQRVVPVMVEGGRILIAPEGGSAF